ncbi:hypothetical protein Tco_0269659 [Tanacetum coccineum]
MDDPNITMEEYIRLEEEKARRRGETFNWQTATYGKREYYDDEENGFTNFKTEFPAIISFDESDDEDYTVIFDKKSFSYKIISANDLKTDLENDNEKVNMPLFPSSEPTVSYFDLDFFKDFDNEFPAIVYNDALTYKLDLLTEPTISPHHIDEFDLKDETSLSECYEEEQNILYFNDLFLFNVIYPDDLKSDTDNDNDKIDIEQPFGDMNNTAYPKVWDTAGLDVPTAKLFLIPTGKLMVPAGSSWFLLVVPAGRLCGSCWSAYDCFVISNRGRLLGITDLMITKPINRNEERRNKRKQDMLKKETRSRLMLIEININVEDID